MHGAALSLELKLHSTRPPLSNVQIQEKGFSVLREAGEYDDLLNRGRMDIMLDNESEKWKILAEGPRRDRPAWLARKTLHITPLPSMPLDQPVESVTAAVPVQLPKPDEVWSIATHKVGGWSGVSVVTTLWLKDEPLRSMNRKRCIKV